MSKKSLRDAYMAIRNHLLTQQTPSMMVKSNDGRRVCAYRGEHGLKCAVGCLIDDDKYTPSMEGHNVDNVRVLTALRDSGWPTNQRAINFYAEAQKIHDNIFVAQWIPKLDSLAKYYGLRA